MSEANGRKRLAIIDGKSVFYRGYYAMPNLSTKDGTPTGGVYGFAVMALEVIKRLKPDYVAVAWDKPKTNIRKRLAMYPEYKAGRKPAPPDFYAQLPILRQLLSAFGWPLYELDDYEADDIMGALSVQATDRDIETMLVTSDLDILQLVSSHAHVYLLKTGLSNIELYNPKSFTVKYGLDATQFLDLKALKGDSSDNIPGVPGIGEKTAIELLKQFHTLDGVYDNLALVKDSIRRKLESGKKLAYLSKKLAAIWTDAPVKLNLEEVDGSKIQPEKLAELLQKLEFRTLVNQLPNIIKLPEKLSRHSAVIGDANTKVNLINTETKLSNVDFGKSKNIVLHSRAAGKNGQKPVYFVVSPDPKELFLFDLTKLDEAKFQQKLGKMLNDPKIGKIGYDIKSTIKVGYSLSIDVEPVSHDVLIAAFVLNSLRREQSLTDLIRSDLGYDGPDLEDLDNDQYIERVGTIIESIWALYKEQAKQIAADSKFAKLVDSIEWPIIPALARMEYKGILLNTEYLKDFSNEINDVISDLEQQIYGHASAEFNISSPGQLADVLFNKLKLPTTSIKKGKTGYSTAASELAKLQATHPIIELIGQYREVTKLKNTYVDTLPKLIDENSRLHTTYSLTVAQTGRLSSSDPNLQNIPVRTDLGRRIRTAFIAGPGKKLISADYSQFELRIAAVLCKDENLIDQFNRDLDVHTATAAQIYNRLPEDVTKNMRRDAKVINFGVMYGLSPHGLMAATEMTYEQAKNFIDRYFEVRPKLLKYIKQVQERAVKDGYVETLFGRRRPTPDIHSSNYIVREAATRAAVNMPFQGTAADIMKIAMIKLDEKYRDTDVDMLLQIHDSVLVEVPNAKAEQVAAEVKDVMEKAVKLPVKLTVDTAIGDNWGQL